MGFVCADGGFFCLLAVGDIRRLTVAVEIGSKTIPRSPQPGQRKEAKTCWMMAGHRPTGLRGRQRAAVAGALLPSRQAQISCALAVGAAFLAWAMAVWSLPAGGQQRTPAKQAGSFVRLFDSYDAARAGRFGPHQSSRERAPASR